MEMEVHYSLEWVLIPRFWEHLQSSNCNIAQLLDWIIHGCNLMACTLTSWCWVEPLTWWRQVEGDSFGGSLEVVASWCPAELGGRGQLTNLIVSEAIFNYLRCWNLACPLPELAFKTLCIEIAINCSQPGMSHAVLWNQPCNAQLGMHCSQINKILWPIWPLHSGNTHECCNPGVTLDHELPDMVLSHDRLCREDTTFPFFSMWGWP